MCRTNLDRGGLVEAWLTLLLIGCLAACEPPPPPGATFQSTAVTGDAAVVESFAGAWYDYDGRKVLVVDVEPSAKLSLLVSSGYRPVDGRTEGGEIRFTFQGLDFSARLALRHLPDGEIMVTPEGELIGYRTTFLTRSPWRQRLAYEAEELGWRVEAAYGDAVEWLIRVF